MQCGHTAGHTVTSRLQQQCASCVPGHHQVAFLFLTVYHYYLGKLTEFL